MDAIFCFEDFETDPDRYQLRQRGHRLKIERIPLELLFLLLERHGSVVSREQIVERLWGSAQFLDTERSINTAIRKIRLALKDDSREPRFVETVVGRGYRFVAPVTCNGGYETHRVAPAESSSAALARQIADGTYEVRLRKFLLEPGAGASVLTCEVVTTNVFVGRVALAELEIPSDMSLPLRPEDRLFIRLLAIRADLTADAAQTLQALCISLLQNGIALQATPSAADGQDGRASLLPVSGSQQPSHQRHAE